MITYIARLQADFAVKRFSRVKPDLAVFISVR